MREDGRAPGARHGSAVRARSRPSRDPQGRPRPDRGNRRRDRPRRPAADEPAVTVDNWLLDVLAALGTEDEEREEELAAVWRPEAPRDRGRRTPARAGRRRDHG